MGNMSKKLIGIGFILTACIYLVSSLGYLENFNLSATILGLLFASAGTAGIIDKRPTQVVYCFGLSYYFLQEVLFFPELTLWAILVTCTLIALGIAFLCEKKSTIYKNANSQYSDSNNSTPINDEVVDVRVAFGETEKFIASKIFQKAHIKSAFGTAKVYLEEAKMLNQESTITLNVSFGTAILYIPKNWEVNPNISSVFGTCTVHDRPEGITNTLSLKGNVSFGHVQVHYV